MVGSPPARERWTHRHHVVESRGNAQLPKGVRAYFDHLPSVVVKERDFYGIVDAPVMRSRVSRGAALKSARHCQQCSWQFLESVLRRYSKSPDHECQGLCDSEAAGPSVADRLEANRVAPRSAVYLEDQRQRCRRPASAWGPAKQGAGAEGRVGSRCRSAQSNRGGSSSSSTAAKSQATARPRTATAAEKPDVSLLLEVASTTRPLADALASVVSVNALACGGQSNSPSKRTSKGEAARPNFFKRSPTGLAGVASGAGEPLPDDDLDDEEGGSGQTGEEHHHHHHHHHTATASGGAGSTAASTDPPSAAAIVAAATKTGLLPQSAKVATATAAAVAAGIVSATSAGHGIAQAPAPPQTSQPGSKPRPAPRPGSAKAKGKVLDFLRKEAVLVEAREREGLEEVVPSLNPAERRSVSPSVCSSAGESCHHRQDVALPPADAESNPRTSLRSSFSSTAEARSDVRSAVSAATATVTAHSEGEQGQQQQQQQEQQERSSGSDASNQLVGIGGADASSNNNTNHNGNINTKSISRSNSRDGCASSTSASPSPCPSPSLYPPQSRGTSFSAARFAESLSSTRASSACGPASSATPPPKTQLQMPSVLGTEDAEDARSSETLSAPAATAGVTTPKNKSRASMKWFSAKQVAVATTKTSSPGAFKGSAFAEVEEFLVFTKWVNEKHKDLARLWNILDRDKSMILTHREFVQGMKELLYRGNIDSLWKLIDRDTSGNVSFLEFAPAAALKLTTFKRWVTERFGSADTLFTALDEDRSGTVTFKEFSTGCKTHGLPENLKDTLKTLFFLLDSDGASSASKGGGSIDKDEILFLDKWEPPPYLMVEPDHAARRAFQSVLLAKHNSNSFVVWRRALDKDSSMRVSFEEFLIQCQVLTRNGIPEANPSCGIPALYAAIDDDRSGWFTFKDWDEESYSRLLIFVNYCRKEAGTCMNWLRRCMDPSADRTNEGIDFKTFSQNLQASGLTPSQRLEIFEGLQAPTRRLQAESGTLFPADLLFLQTWNPVQEEHDDKLWSNLLASHGVS